MWRAPVPGTQHLLLALLDGVPDVAAVFAQQNVDVQSVREAVRRISG
ncbi:MAG: Clp protease N-terminal domain-containing protein [Methylobacteriaceae bacterium]|nr:Clp protease N-terminal domain-containing protein [Methylobacteriaceae bacterium]